MRRSCSSVRPRAGILSVLLLTAAAACDSPSTPVSPQSVAVAAGNGQTAEVGQPLATPLTVTVTGSNGQPYSGATVTWQVTAGGGSVSPASSQTDAQGRASTTWTLGPAPGAQAAAATVQGLSPASFTATATVGAIATITVSPTSPVIDALQGTVQLSAQARDALDNIVPGATVVWSSAAPGVVAVNAQTGVATGVATGTAQVTATAGGVSGNATVEVRQVAAQLAVTPANPRVAQDGTLQLTATTRDANGFDIPGVPAVSWTSADNAIATVNAAGVVTGVAGGTARITASLGTLSANTDVLVAAHLALTEHTPFSGDVVVGRLTVPANITLIAAGDLDITALGTVEIAGSVAGDCVAISVHGSSAVTVTGDMTNTCSTEPAGEGPGIVLRSDGPLTLTGATFTYEGSLDISNDAGSASAARATRTAGVTQSGACVVTATVFEPSRPAARAGINGKQLGTPGASAGAVRLSCDGDLEIGGGSGIAGRDGGDGGDSLNPDPPTADGTGRGGNGGNGGDVEVRSTGNIRFNGTTLVLARGGDGGDATVLGLDPGGNATAEGGAGGDGGNTRVEAAGSITIESGGLQIILGRGGHGGEAIANAGNGRDAGTSAATNGGSATATGGAGGHSVAGMLRGNGGVNGLSNIEVSGGDGGQGGAATAVAGRGGHGNAEFPDGADGGGMQANGGNGGTARAKDITGTVTGTSGNGGNIRIVHGIGGNGANRCPDNPGGSGGRGGNASGAPGQRGGGDNPGVHGRITVAAAAGNGGNGNNGDGPGAGGAGGTDGLAGGFVRVDEGDNFRDGANGNPCAPPVQRRVQVDFSAVPHTNGSVSAGTHVVPLRDAETGEQVGTMPLTTLGTEGNFFFGANPPRVGVTGAGNGWRFEVGGNAGSFEVCFVNTTGISAENPIHVVQRNAQGEVVASTQISSPEGNTAGARAVATGGAAGAAIGCHGHGAHLEMFFVELFLGDGAFQSAMDIASVLVGPR